MTFSRARSGPILLYASHKVDLPDLNIAKDGLDELEFATDFLAGLSHLKKFCLESLEKLAVNNTLQQLLPRLEDFQLSNLFIPLSEVGPHPLAWRTPMTKDSTSILCC